MTKSFCRRQFLFSFAFLIIGLLVSDPASAQNLLSFRSCEASPAYSRYQILLFLDRTTELDANAQARYDQGIEQILGDQSVAGQLSVLEIRDLESEVPSLGTGCISTDLNDPYGLDSGDIPKKSFLDSILSYTFGVFSSLFRVQSTNNDLTDEGSADDEEKSDDLTARAAATTYLEHIIVFNDPTATSTEIPETIISGIQSYCGNRQVCRVFIYTDLLDSKAKKDFSDGDNMTNEGKIEAQSLIQEFSLNLSNTVIRVNVWGFGRDDIGPGVPLSEPKRKGMEAYWSSFFKVLCGEGAKGSSFVISDSLS